MDRDEIVRLLHLLGRRLADQGVQGEMSTVHGDEVLAVAADVFGDRLDIAAQLFLEEALDPT